MEAIAHGERSTMIVRAAKPSELTTKERDEFIAFVMDAGEVSRAMLPGLVARAAVLVTLHHGLTLVGTSALKVPNEAHRRGEFRKARVGECADAYPLELGWVVVHPDYRGRGHAHALVTTAIEAAPRHGLYATTKTDPMRNILPKHGFVVQGKPYSSILNPQDQLTLFGRLV